MTDIVERLRDPSKGSPRWLDMLSEAADEIERLRAALRVADAVLSGANRNLRVVEEMVSTTLWGKSHD